MPVTIYPSKTQRQAYVKTAKADTDIGLLNGAVHHQLSDRCKEIFQSSFSETNANVNANIFPSSNSFVRTVCTAYNNHHSLVLRPDDVWLAILTQFNFFVNANAEALRGQFVAHKGKKELTIVAVGTRYTVDFGGMAYQMGRLMQKNVVDPELRGWILPDFTTTETNDRIVASVVMMATLRAYFDYKFCCMCGIPEVTLLGMLYDHSTVPHTDAQDD